MIAVYDDFSNALGEFPNYDTYDPGQRTQLALQKHVDIRSFEELDIREPITMFELDAMHMSLLDTMTMEELEGFTIVQEGEHWTAGVVGPQADRDYFDGISLSCGSGETDTESIMVHTIDISAFTDPDFISLALPDFPISDLTLASTFLDLSSDGFTTVASLPFSTATLNAVGGDYEARFLLSGITGINTTKINAVRFRITATTSCTFRCLAIRAIASTWAYGSIDQNNLYDRLQGTVPPSGSLSEAIPFPTAVAPVFPSDFPILLFSDGDFGPTLVDIDLGFTIDTGSFATGNTNTFILYLRELPMTTTPMSTMDALTMADLEALPHVPDWDVGNIDDFSHTQSTWVIFQWGATNAVAIHDTITGQSYTYAASFAEDTTYYAMVQQEDDSLRVRVYPQDYRGVIDWSTLVFDSTAIVDNNFNRRRRGRLGWYAQLSVGNSYVRRFRPRRVVYSEYRSAPFYSVTPVIGAQIYPSSTLPHELYAGATATTGAILTPDVTKSTSGKCLKVVCDGDTPLEGLKSAPIRFEDLLDTIVTFDFLALSTPELAIVLRGEGRLIVVNTYPLPANHWNHIELPLELIGEEFIPGVYSLYILQGQPQAGTFYVDNLSISQPTVAWEGRVPAADPWRQNDPIWLRYGDKINNPYDGALLGRDKTLQVRGQVIAADGFIDRVKIIPVYAQLGRFVWGDEAPSYSSIPLASFTYVVSPFVAQEVSFDGSASLFATAEGFYRWSFGDDTWGYGQKTTHTYLTAGTYTVTLTAVDQRGSMNLASQVVTVT